MNVGVCRNAVCAKSLSGELIDRYPGPGQFCPDCGELLQSAPNGRASVTPLGTVAPRVVVAPRGTPGPEDGGARSGSTPSNGVAAASSARATPAADPAARAPAAGETPPAPTADQRVADKALAADPSKTGEKAVDGTSAGQSTADQTAANQTAGGPTAGDQTAADRTGEDPAADPPLDSFARFRNDLRAVLADHQPDPPVAVPARRMPLLALVAIIAVVGIALVVLRPVMTSSKAPLRVCGSSVTTRVAGDILAAYAAKNAGRAVNSSVVSSGPCDVQFAAAPHPGSGTEIARDGVVLIVHPRNPITRLSQAQFRRIVSGEITDWSQLGGPRGTIFIVLPSESTDERRAIAQTALRGTRVASRVLHVASSADIVRLVSGANGRRWLGVVAFSEAVPAKVLPLGSAPTPSAVTIANNRYPLTLDVTVNASDGRNAAAGSLIAFARSREAEAIVSRDGFVAKSN